MIIIIDTREQLPLSFTGHETFSRKLDEGDYNTTDLEDKIVIERKSPQDLYQSITSDHQRFKREIKRAIEKKKKFYIFIEGTLEDFYWLRWAKRDINMKPGTLYKIILTMKERYGLIFVECITREIMVTKIIETIEKERTQARE